MVGGFETSNRYQVQLKNLTLAMIAYMEEHWCEPGRGADFARWWCIVVRYSRALASPEMAGPRARKVLAKLIGENQARPSDL